MNTGLDISTLVQHDHI